MVFSWKQISNVALRRGLAPMCGTPGGCGPRAIPGTAKPRPTKFASVSPSRLRARLAAPWKAWLVDSASFY
jgi:hypothetical protein